MDFSIAHQSILQAFCNSRDHGTKELAVCHWWEDFDRQVLKFRRLLDSLLVSLRIHTRKTMSDNKQLTYFDRSFYDHSDPNERRHMVDSAMDRLPFASQDLIKAFLNSAHEAVSPKTSRETMLDELVIRVRNSKAYLLSVAIRMAIPDLQSSAAPSVFSLSARPKTAFQRLGDFDKRQSAKPLTWSLAQVVKGF